MHYPLQDFLAAAIATALLRCISWNDWQRLWGRVVVHSPCPTSVCTYLMYQQTMLSKFPAAGFTDAPAVFPDDFATWFENILRQLPVPASSSPDVSMAPPASRLPTLLFFSLCFDAPYHIVHFVCSCSSSRMSSPPLSLQLCRAAFPGMIGSTCGPKLSHVIIWLLCLRLCRLFAIPCSKNSPVPALQLQRLLPHMKRKPCCKTSLPF